MTNKTILIGIGNDGRGDDALGWLFADRFAATAGVDVACRYQLQVEDAELIRHYDRVIFADASLEEMENGFYFQPCQPAASLHFSTHRISPATILWLSREIYQSAATGYVLAIRGYRWELHQGLSPEAERNLNAALSYFGREVLPVFLSGFEKELNLSA